MAAQQQIQQLQAQLETVEAVAQDSVTREALEAERDEAIAAAARQADQVAELQHELQQLKAMLSAPANENTDTLSS